MRLIITTLLFWLLLSSTASADVIFPGDPPRSRPRPRYPVERPLVPLPVVVPADDEPLDPSIEPEPDPETTPEEAGFAIVAISLFVAALSVRESTRGRRSERRPA